MRVFNKVMLFLTIVGAINWFTIALFQLDFFALLLGNPLDMPARIVYAIVGLSGIWCISLLFHDNDVKVIKETALIEQ